MNTSLTAVGMLAALLTACVAADKADGEAATDTQTQASQEKDVMDSHVRREGTRVYLAGLEDAFWGGTSDRQNSVAGAMHAAFSVMKEGVKYSYIMGIGGAGFRLQFMWCGSSPHSYCGYDCAAPALNALGYSLTKIKTLDMKTGENIPDGIATARQEIVKSIDAGRAVLADSAECSLIVGYLDGGQEFLVREYSAEFSDTKHGYKKMKAWPWSVGIITPRAEPSANSRFVEQSLKRAVTLARTPKQEGYHSGFAAFDVWATELRDDKTFASLDSKELRNRCRVNAWIYGCLNTARKAAAEYLRDISGEYDEQIGAELIAAAEEYSALAEKIGKGSDGLPGCWFLFPWDLKGAKNWTQEMRHGQADMLDEVLANEKKAIAHIENALTLMNKSGSR